MTSRVPGPLARKKWGRIGLGPYWKCGSRIVEELHKTCQSLAEQETMGQEGQLDRGKRKGWREQRRTAEGKEWVKKQGRALKRAVMKVKTHRYSY